MSTGVQDALNVGACGGELTQRTLSPHHARKL
jgi:hypothetical protein